MKKLLVSTFVLLTFISNLALAEIYEISHFNEIFNYLKPGTLIVYDIDDTLISMNQQLGSDQWFFSQFARHQNEGMSKSDALELALNEWESVQHLSGCKPVEAQNPQIVSETQQHYPVIGLSTRGLGLATRTRQLLAESGYDLSKNPITQNELHFMQQNEGVLFRKGVLFTAGTHKGECLEKLLNAVGFTPERILFINDKKTHLEPVEQFCERAAIPFIGLRYGYVDAQRAAYNPLISDIQWKHFGEILSDQEAEGLIPMHASGESR